MLDTEALLLGLGWQKAPSRRLVHAVLAGRVVPITSPPLLEELERTVRRRELRPAFKDPERVVRLLTDVSMVVEPAASLSVVPDESGNRILEAARAGGADYVVTGQVSLLRLGEFAGAKIVRPHPH